jgi:hypothetical protein
MGHPPKAARRHLARRHEVAERCACCGSDDDKHPKLGERLTRSGQISDGASPPSLQRCCAWRLILKPLTRVYSFAPPGGAVKRFRRSDGDFGIDIQDA